MTQRDHNPAPAKKVLAPVKPRKCWAVVDADGKIVRCALYGIKSDIQSDLRYNGVRKQSYRVVRVLVTAVPR